MRHSTTVFFCGRYWLLLFLALQASCDVKPQQNEQRLAIKKDGQTFQVADHDTSTVVSNQIRVASRIQVVGRNLSNTEWWLDRQVLQSQPRWNGLTQELPISAKEACALALPDIRSRFPEVKDWRVQTIYLRNLNCLGASSNADAFPDVWIYEITFEPSIENSGKSLEDTVGVGALTQVVLLDGNVVQPKAGVERNQK